MGTRVVRTIFRTNLPGLATVLVLIGLWQFVIVTGLFTFRFVPPPSAVIADLSDLVSSVTFLREFRHTVGVTLLGWLVAAVTGGVIGTLLGLSAAARRWSSATVDVFRALPAIALVPVAVLLFGLSSKMEMAIVIYAAVWPVLIATAGGIVAVPQGLRDVARTLHLGRRRYVVKVVLPFAAGPAFVGLRLALSVALVLAVVAEMVGNPAGLGYGLISAQHAIRADRVFGYIAVIGTLGFLLNGAFKAVARLALPGLGSHVD